MKKNKMMRLASFLLIAVLVSTSAISGTYAKYVSKATADDTARVAHWGVAVEVTGDEAFKKEYEGTADPNNGDGLTVKSSTEKKLVAPGTDGTLATFTVTGSPEVDALVTVSATVTMSDWLIDHDENGITDFYYCPLYVTVGSTVLYGNNYASAVLFAGEIKKEIQKYTAYYNAHDDLALNQDVEIEWAWAFDEADVAAAQQLNKYDTILGDKAATLGDVADYIELELSVTVEQVD